MTPGVTSRRLTVGKTCTIIISTSAAPTFASGTSELLFASVVYVPKMLKRWQKLGDDKMLALLHKKYWGNPLEPDERGMG
jgi:hypothetical protein